jgi:hypothetical protein
MTQVEQAVKEKSGVTQMFGVAPMGHVFGEGAGIKLRVPFGEQMQKAAESYFKGHLLTTGILPTMRARRLTS